MDADRTPRERLVAAARSLAAERGWDKVRMADVARAAGMSRQTVYNEFGDRAGVAQALAVWEIEQFTGAVRERLFAAGADVRGAAYAAILHTLREAAGNPLIRSILDSSADGLFPYLTTRSDLVLAAAATVIREWADACVPGVDAALAAESIVRLTVSHIVLPGESPEASAAALAEVFVRLLR
ncbi:TetR family transcriptional regulator [Actinoplanes sp. SE50]|uniref:TetR/AcrR family transcriptional regulator n=1 Tax=unclassified Actinoplanes TaxID=2626549 RepID=UPI00023EC136|nr:MULTISPECIES: TetR family transcriptional regulator [unclassified Actinoplanes]AEV85802.1 TetR family transcriptional regulator [Actinoplanes sp. SE50/110]ATO84196.1 TetR family transcriptional regulator [Actinoplanes sp. SE50]SLM01606.1 TetR family transcriptional regulator [Actinoplanes sp. SE50/110]